MAKLSYIDQALELYKKKGDFIKPLQKHHIQDLKRYQSSGVVKMVEFLSAPDSCDKCKSLHGKRISIKDALRVKALPIEDCDRGYCRCVFIPVVD